MKCKSIISISKPCVDAKYQLLCIPYAGGSTRAFFSWNKFFMNKKVEVLTVAYPGREYRINEEPIINIDILLDKIVEKCKKCITKKLIVFGHSMGSIIGFGLVKKLEEVNINTKLLFVSAAAPPIKPSSNPKISSLPKELFISTLVQKYKAIPDTVLNNRELMDLFVPILRTDIAMEEQYIEKYHKQKQYVKSNIIAFGGIEDTAIKKEDLISWKKLTKGLFSYKIFPGAHFYLNEYQELVLHEIHNILHSDIFFKN